MNLKEKSCGVILVLRNDNEDKFLILQQTQGNWSFPKGHIDGDETPIECAIRELSEEAGITDVEFAELPSIEEYYVVDKAGQKYDKTVELFIAFAKNDKVIIQESEIINYKWVTYQEAINLFNFPQVLKTAQKYLQNVLK